MSPTPSSVGPVFGALSHDDIFDVNGVSGFYGPGAWSAWFLILVTSWIATIRGDYSNNIHHIGYLLYTNWAAVDLIRQSIKLSTSSADTSSTQLHANGSLAAALLITSWGTIHAASQFLYTYASRYQNDVSERRRRRLLALGSIIPLCAGISMSIYLYHHPITEKHKIPAFYFDGLRISSHRDIVNFLVYVLPWVLPCSATLIEVLLNFRRSGIFDSDLSSPYLVRATDCVVVSCFLTSTIPAIFISWAYVILWIFSGATFKKKSCMFMPCAPQSMSEWDQCFALFAGLVMFIYEFGVDIRGWVVQQFTRPARKRPIMLTHNARLQSAPHLLARARKNAYSGTRISFENLTSLFTESATARPPRTALRLPPSAPPHLFNPGAGSYSDFVAHSVYHREDSIAEWRHVDHAMGASASFGEGRGSTLPMDGDYVDYDPYTHGSRVRS
jgi:hypothetical protein